MPNWVYNNVTIKGDFTLLNKVREQLNAPFTRQNSVWDIDTASYVLTTHNVEEPVFSFWNIIKPTDMEAYDKPSNAENMNDPDNWYAWNNRNWGTKWDVAGSVDFNLNDEGLHYSFDTAWAPPVPALVELSTQYPDLEIVNAWEEEQGFGSTMTFNNGEMEEDGEYNWLCPECDYRELGDPSDNYNDEIGDMVCPNCQWGSVQSDETTNEGE